MYKVDLALRKKKETKLECYEELTSLLPATIVKKKRAKKTDDGALLI